MFFFLLFVGLNTGQKLNNNVGNLSPEINLPLLTHASVILGENSVKYKHSKTATLPVQLPTTEPHEIVEDQIKCIKTSEIPCSIPAPLPNETQDSPPIIQQSCSHANLHEQTVDPL